MFTEETLTKIKDKLLDVLFEIGPDILISIVVLVLGAIFIRLISRLLRKSFRKYNIEPSLATFIQSLVRFMLYAILIVSVGTTLGIKTSSFVAIIGAAGLAIGLALQGSLANFAGGVLILIFKPFKVDDLIFVNGKLGIVSDIDILYTRLTTFDNRIITIPNGTMANSDIDNRTMQDKRRVDITLKFSYDEDMTQIRRVVVDAMKKHPRILKDPEPDVWLDDFREYDMKVAARCWVAPEEWWPIYWEQLEAIKEALDEAGIKIPIPKNEVSFSDQNTNEAPSKPV
ncbi:MAG TPA: mechanosensitive ion channel domain-containing protein [Salinivirga sp.]|uniref:mechanosensitive ion channel family protein n=1 Tax=Salinivirga sp. TaxID=1970192 RepID=UPI002B48AAE1|nr:mechanosensitive ion channel domain-containing protein [Salinivirga sp.]HKK57950.1 mechanosensitive ion channel domain-containing protein [Salinivirga sp.]